jgi:hypothetical protein
MSSFSLREMSADGSLPKELHKILKPFHLNSNITAERCDEIRDSFSPHRRIALRFPAWLALCRVMAGISLAPFHLTVELS